LFGLDGATSGTLEINGRAVTDWSPRRAIEAGLAFCPEDRKLEGLVGHLTVRENIMLAVQASRAIGSPVSNRQQHETAARYVQQLKIKTPSVQTCVATLSGGNQQKVLLARWLATNPKVLILDEPTRGIDIGAKAEIEQLIAQLRDSGLAVILVSSELEDIVRTCDRVVVLRDRRIVGEVAGADISQQRLMEMIAHHDAA
jgi:simple sugar transport system ATP-binding protein